jgi:cation:H+ antiporter
MTYVLFVAGLALLLGGGEWLVKGAAGLAVRMKVSPLVIGVTVVSLGTSAPELLVSVKAAVDGFPAISIGNVIGSNIANIGLVMGLVALIMPMKLTKTALTLDWPVMFSASLLFYLMAFDGVIQFYEGIFLLILFVFYVSYSILKSRRNTKNEEQRLLDDEGPEEEFEDLKVDPKTPVWKLLGMVVVGSTALVLGARWFLDGAIEMARIFGVTEHVISVTLIAFGTSVPELATSAIAAFRKQSDISVGNLIGSNSFNILGILGITALVRDIPIGEGVLDMDMLWMIGIAVLVLPFLLIGKKIYRMEGLLLLIAYILYIYFVISGAKI